MSTYINVSQNIIPKYSECPEIIRQFLNYLRVRKNRSENTVNAYYLDLQTFIRYLMLANDMSDPKTNFHEISIKDFPSQLLLDVSEDDIDSFLYFVAEELQNSPKTMARKLSAIKCFYGYLIKKHILEKDPSTNIDTPVARQRNRQPIYLTAKQCMQLLSNIDTAYRERDFCIITLLLNCGMRISELVGINVANVYLDDGYIRILGKGNKERTAYLNKACLEAVKSYLEARKSYGEIIDKDALFVSPRTGRRLTPRGIQVMVEKVLQAAGLSGMHFSPHKFRHTTATLMYQSGVDLLTLKELLGHEDVSTTQIYAHIKNGDIVDAVDHSPLADFDIDQAKGQMG